MTARTLLTDELLAAIRARAAAHDAENTFPHEDVADLKAAGYLTALVPAESGGAGLTLQELSHEQMRLAAASPATALAVNMHHVWVGVARQLAARGDHSVDFVFDDVMAGEIYAFGISEPGNDLVLFGSTADAKPDGTGGFSFTGTKIFTSGSPVWTRLGTFGADRSDPDRPMDVFGFITRDGGGVTVKDDWDTLGMRASQSCTTILNGAHAPADRIACRIEPGPTMHPFVFGIFSSFILLTSSVYVGLAQRMLDLAVEAAKRRTSAKNSGRAYAQDPDARRRIAQAAIALDGLYPQLDRATADIDGLVDRGPMWMPQLSAIKYRVSETVQEIATSAMKAAGGASYFTKNELSRLYRDALAAVFHPTSEDSVHGMWASALLGPLES
ncbi:MAG: acyl-CoA dehydrogenase [Actinobacteria bacterium 69-20]|jgi:alkylation response protein AidB-like acyl-CoA dehydrogenase|nr:acyl-CoA/acyl-ACP dehydrogenase [Actinomycetota bacterium]OJV24767.1 MAG: acyl-CoA dehydrogenase [Actinobacteria bacterium 69-20]